MGRRIDLHDTLLSLLGTSAVYYQPPESIKMMYPCIVYERSPGDTQFADNGAYIHKRRYSITAIYEDPDSDLPDKIANLPMCIHDRHFTSNNLNHDVFNMYY